MNLNIFLKSFKQFLNIIYWVIQDDLILYLDFV